MVGTIRFLFYFLKKEKDDSKNETIIPYKTRKDVDLVKINELEKTLQKKTGEADLRLIRWSDVIGKIVPASRVFKIPFFDSRDIEIKLHPWRICPIGEHWVRRHPKYLGSGKVTDHDGHCRNNKKSKSEFYHADELNSTADLVKALMVTESSFEMPKDHDSTDGTTRGLIQVTEGTRKILQDIKGELKNHHLDLTADESREPVTNVAAGVRWLHHKKYLLEKRIKRKATWKEAAFEYKGIFNDIGKDRRTDRIVKEIKAYNKRLKEMRTKK